nr:MAG TPA: hypothetical protein [Caudoviricetes sp.]
MQAFFETFSNFFEHISLRSLVIEFQNFLKFSPKNTCKVAQLML